MSNFYILEKDLDQGFTLKNISSNLNMGKYEIVNMKSYPSDNFSATSKKYVDDENKKLLDLAASRQMRGDLDMNNNTIIGVKNIAASNSVVSKLDKFLKKSGGTMSGNINLNNRRITNLPNPTHLLHPANKDYVDEEIKKVKIPLVYNYNFGFTELTHNAWEYPAGPLNSHPFPWMNTDGLDEDSYFELGVHTFDSDNNIPSGSMTMEYRLEAYEASGGLRTWTFFDGNLKGYQIPLEPLFCVNQKYYFKNFPSGNYKQFKLCRISVKRKFSSTFGNESSLSIAIVK